MADGTLLIVIVPKEDIDKLTRLAETVERLMNNTTECKKALTNADPLKTITMSDIKKYYGIGKDKWRSGVKSGRFPKPIEGFDKPKRWTLSEVEASLNKGA